MLLCLIAVTSRTLPTRSHWLSGTVAETASEAWVAALALSDLPKTVRAVCVAAAKWRKLHSRTAREEQAHSLTALEEEAHAPGALEEWPQLMRPPRRCHYQKRFTRAPIPPVRGSTFPTHQLQWWGGSNKRFPRGWYCMHRTSRFMPKHASRFASMTSHYRQPSTQDRTALRTNGPLLSEEIARRCQVGALQLRARGRVAENARYGRMQAWSH